ncbi:IS4 family transposase [Clostridium sp. DJ247]|nr:IS4 family transposase [Clostridium sp. DJ247]
MQLQYDILSGQFLSCDVGNAATSDTSYIPETQKSIQPKDLILKDLGYFKMDDLKIINKNEAYYISKLKKYTVIYISEEKRYAQVDILEKAKSLKEGETLDIPDAYVESNKNLKTRLIITKLSEENKKKRELKNQKADKRYKSRMDDERLDIWNSINIYVTNIDKKALCAEQIHELYTLRWQVEVMFKIWKSIFKIDRVKKVKLHRFQCFLYGKLISILLNSIIVFKAKEYIGLNEKKHISEFKSFAIVKEYSCNIRNCIFSKLGKQACPRKGTRYHPQFVEKREVVPKQP